MKTIRAGWHVSSPNADNARASKGPVMSEAVRHDKTARQLRLLSDALDSGRLGPVRRLVNTLAPAEIGNLLESLPPGKRAVVWGLVDPEDDGEVLVHVGEEVRESLLAEMDPDEIVAAVEDLDIDDLADLVEDLPGTVIEEVLKSMDRENRERLEQVLSYPEDSAGRLMNPDVVTVRADVTVDVVLRYLRLRGELPEHTDHLFVVSRRHQYLGRLSLSALLTHEDATPINELVDGEQPAIQVDLPAAQVANQFSDHDWISAPVVDANNILLGRITIDDVVDIIREQAEHQALAAAGLDEDEDLFSPVPRAVKRRMLWLGINLGTAFLAASVVGRFEGTIEKIVALAVLMPIVAGMGGNAGTQVLALMVRGLALGQVGAANVRILLWKELRVALLNGLALGAVLGGVVWLWFGDVQLSLVIATALTLNLLFAAAAGVLVPLTLKRMGFDPALAGGVILTTVTDVMGFLAFLGLATLVLLR
jgi:magnesium transporter